MESTKSEGGAARLEAGVRDILVRVLMVEEADLRPEAELVADLGAESIDFVDLLFQLEDLIGRRVTPEDWQDWITERLPDPSRGQGITVAVIQEFARYFVAQGAAEQ